MDAQAIENLQAEEHDQYVRRMMSDVAFHQSEIDRFKDIDRSWKNLSVPELADKADPLTKLLAQKASREVLDSWFEGDRSLFRILDARRTNSWGIANLCHNFIAAGRPEGDMKRLAEFVERCKRGEVEVTLSEAQRA